MTCRVSGVELGRVHRFASRATDMDQTSLECLQSDRVNEGICAAIDKCQEHCGMVPLPREVQAHPEIERKEREVIGCPAQHIHDCNDDDHHCRVPVRFDKLDVGFRHCKTFGFSPVLALHSIGSVEISFPLS